MFKDCFDVGFFDSRMIVEIGLQIVEVLCVVYDFGFVYGDVKFFNIGFICSGIVKLIDFGFVLLLNEIKGGMSLNGVEFEVM